MSRQGMISTALAVWVCTAVAATASAAISLETFESDLRALTANPHRLAGFEDGSLAAGNYVLQRLKDIGFEDENIFLQDFTVVQPITTQCELVAGGVSYPILPMRPNVVQASITPQEGLTGEVVYAGRGDVAEYGSSYPQGKIVAMDLDSADNWLNAFAFGAKAVLFLGPPEGPTPDIRAYQHASVPANLPRFYAPRELVETLDLTHPQHLSKVTLRAACQWKELRARNVIAVLRGTDPMFEKDPLRQTVVLAAPLDSYSEVPRLSPGARDAGNCAVLLQLAEYLRKHRPRRDVVLCFFDGQTLNHAGARAFYGALYRRIKNTKLADASLDDRLEEQDEESAYFRRILEVLDQEDLLGPAAGAMSYFDDTLRLLREEARRTSDGIEEVLSPKRVALEEAQIRLTRLGKAAQAARTADERAPLEAQIRALTATEAALEGEIEVLAEQSMRWNSVQRVLRYKRPDPNSRDTFDQLVTMLRDKCLRRLGEIAQASEETRLGKRLYEAIGPQRSNIVLHLSINLGDARREWTFIHGDDSAPLDNDRTGNYTNHFKVINAIARALGNRASGFEDRAVSLLYDNRLFAPGRFADSSSVARLFSVWNLSVMTVMDRLPRQGLPTDTLAALDSKTLYDPVREIAVFLKHLADDEGINLLPKTRAEVRFGDASWTGVKSLGPTVRLTGLGGALRTRPVSGALVAVGHNEGWTKMPLEKSVPGFVEWFLCKTNVHGIFETGPYSTNYYKKPYFVAVLLDRSTENDGPGATGRGLIQAITNTSKLGGNAIFSRAAIDIFQTHHKTLVNYGADRGAASSIAMRAMSTAAFPKDRSLVCEWGNVSVVFAPTDAKGLKLFNKMTLVALNNEATKELYQGQGLSLGDPFEHPPSQPMTAHDLRTLNEYRLKVLREVRIHQESLEALTGRAKDLETDARTARGSAPVSWYFGTLETAAAFSRLVYIPLIGVMKDLVTAVVLLLLLAMPFAYALERLLIGTPHIYRQIGWFTVFFLLTFALLFAVNPAFKIASTPIIIFLAFAIILLSSLVIFIMVRKLQAEVRKMQGLAATVHSADVSRLSTMMAAVNMGISTMRRRPLRTLLTATTVVLLTFTILTFASFGSSWGIWPSYQGTMAGTPPHIIVRHPLWSPITEGIFQTLRGHLAPDAEVVPRIWVSATAQQTKDAYAAGASLEKLLSDAQAERIVPMAAAIGLDTADLADSQGRPRQQQLAELFSPSARMDLLNEDGIFLTEAIANELRLTEADIGQAKLLWGGMTFTYAGTVSDRLAIASMLEGSSVLPVDYEASAGESEENIKQQAETTLSLVEMPDVQSAQFVTFNVDKVVIIPAAKARRLDGTIRSISVYPSDDKIAAIRDMADTVTRITQLPTHVGDQGGVHRLVFTSLAKASGWRDLLVPVVLGGLIIFATMLGSVSDREREIYTFSSLGLAPPHVASLFFAEASMYAVIGGMGGYLLGQVVARLLAVTSTAFGWTVPTMNYSSTNAIVTILLVMGTVLVSTIYPAIKASRSANPGIQRTWQIPKPKGNLYDLVFPFTVSTYDITGVVSFLREHFENYTDTSLGVFATTSCAVFRQKDNDMLGFQATVALAPFDLGVNQRFALLSQPSDIEGIDEVRILIYRLSGAPGDWQRGNRVFINDLRKQLLIWRSLPAEVMDRYRAKTLQGWDQLPAEQIDGETIGVVA